MFQRSFAILLASSLAVGVLTAASESGPTPAEVTGLRFTPATVDVTDGPRDVMVEVDVEDLDAAVQYLHVRLTDAAGRSVGSSGSYRWSGTAQDGTWRTKVRIPQYVAPGDWEAGISIESSDRYVDLSSGDLEAQGLDPTVTVNDDAPDLSPPELVEVELDRSEADVSEGPGTVTATVRVEDALAGVEDVYLQLERRSSNGVVVGSLPGGWATLEGGDRNDGQWVTRINIPRTAGDGRWYLHASLYDKASNGVQLSSSRIATDHPNGYVTVTGTAPGAQPDGDGPGVTSIAMDTTSIDVTEGSRRVRIDVGMADPSGVNSVELHLRADDRSLYASTERWSGSPEDGAWRGYVEVPDFVAPGDYRLELWTHDEWGTYGYYTNADLVDLNVGPTVLRVENATPDVDAPSLEGFEASTREVDTSDGAVDLPVLIAASDDDTGVASVSLHVAYTGTFGWGYRYGYGGFLDGDRLNGTWNALLVFYPSDRFGPWEAGVTLYDFAGNGAHLGADDLRELGFDPRILVGRRPPTPEGLEATPAGDLTSVALTWDEVVDPTGQTIVGYRILRDGEVVGETAGTTLRYVDRGLLPATAYRWSVVAVGQFLPSLPSTEVCGTTDAVTTSLHPSC